MQRRMVLLTQGFSTPGTGKTAAGLLRYCADECVGVLDATLQGQLVREHLGAGGELRFIASLDEVPSANMIVMGIAPPGGKIPTEWRTILLDAIARGMDILSGLHDFLGDDPELAAAARQRGTRIIDVRKNNFRNVARRTGLNDNCFRVHTVGHDCSIGKMVVSLELARELQRRGRDACFVATGQTGIMVSGAGLPLDCIVADFVSGGAEQLVLDNQHHEILVIEGQGSLVHPSYSGVTLGLLHGCLPHALIFCFEAGRKTIRGLSQILLPSLEVQFKLFEQMANIYQPCHFLGFGMNASHVHPDEAADIAVKIEREFGLPVVDVIQQGPKRLADVVETYFQSDQWRRD
jgi:uncharacterized NAD-dependent epimerase/dehydratase family protein